MSAYRGIMSDIEWRSPGGRVVVGIFFVTLILVSLIVIFPFFFAFTAGLKNSTDIYRPGLDLWPETPIWANYAEAWQRLDMLTMFKNSFIVGLGGVFGRLLVSTMAAYSLARLKPKGKRIIELFILITLTIPLITYLVPLYVTLANLPILKVSLVNSYWGLWIPYSANAFAILVLKNAFEQIPQEIYDAAAIDGASEFRMFFVFTLPLAKSLIIVLALLAFIGMWGDFLLPLLVLRDSELQTVSVRLFNLTRSFPVNLHMAGSFIAMIPPTVVAFFLQRYMKGGLTF
jgi:multiple sugar transport system permease protein